MKRHIPALALALALALGLAAAAPAAASDLFRRPDVPSAKDRPKNQPGQDKSVKSLDEATISKKIVKSAKASGPAVDNTRPKASLQ